MIIQRKPIELLKPYIDEFWYIDEPYTNEPDIIIPTGQIHLVFNYGDSYKLIIDDDEIEVPKHALFGQFKMPLYVKYNGCIKQLGIAFKPSAFLMFFGMSSGLCLNSIINSLEFRDNGLMKELIQTGKKTSCVNEAQIFDDIELLLIDYIMLNKKTKLLASMIDYVEKRAGDVDIKVMAKSFHYSVNSIERMFKNYFGLTPKAYSNLVKFKKGIISEDPKALFYDQSHFIKSCKKYTLKSPNELNNVSEITLKHMIKDIE